jgi:hypothetical protein
VWSHTFGGWNRSSSPVIADVNGDGRNDIVHGHQDGYIRVLDAATGNQPPRLAANRTKYVRASRTAIDGSPAVGDLDRDGTNEVVVPAARRGRRNQPGGIVVFRRDGSIKCRFETRDEGNVWRTRVVPTVTRTACTRRLRSVTSMVTTTPTSCSAPGTCASTRSTATVASCPASP